MTAERKSAWILGSIAAVECGWVSLNFELSGWRFLRYLGFAPGRAGTLLGWIAAAAVAIVFVVAALRLPSVRANLARPSLLKLLALFVAIGAGILEEVMFRRWTMNWLLAHGYGTLIQILGSGLLFGVLHGVWGLMGKSLRAAAGAAIATGLLGMMLAIVFVLSGRTLLPCIAAHFAINLLIEPGLVLSAVKGEMGSSHAASV